MTLKLKNMGKHTAKIFSFIIGYIPDQYNTQQMSDKAILKNVGTLKSVPDCYKNQQMCDKAVDNYPYALKFVPECYKTEKWEKAVDAYLSTIEYVPY